MFRWFSSCFSSSCLSLGPRECMGHCLCPSPPSSLGLSQPHSHPQHSNTCCQGQATSLWFATLNQQCSQGDPPVCLNGMCPTHSLREDASAVWTDAQIHFSYLAFLLNSLHRDPWSARCQHLDPASQASQLTHALKHIKCEETVKRTRELTPQA